MQNAAEQMTLFGPDSWCGKTSREHSAATAGKTLPPSLKKLSASRSQTRPLCLCLQGGGPGADACTMKWEDGALLGEFTTRSFGASPSAGSGSLLSQILEECPHPKYNLSARACVGVLRRAKRRGKELPEILDAALKLQICRELTQRAAERGKEPAPFLTRYAAKIRAELTGEDAPIYCLDGNCIEESKTATNIFGGTVIPTIVASAYKGPGNTQDGMVICVPDYVSNVAHSLRVRSAYAFRENAETYITVRMNVRRLTPLECDRLQGYPDNWTDIGEWTDSKGKKHDTSDSNRYKADGNSIALPFWFWLLRRISAQYERPATLGSLFDGIGGFPLCWERCNGKGTALWASEIDEFAIAVTRRRLGE